MTKVVHVDDSGLPFERMGRSARARETFGPASVQGDRLDCWLGAPEPTERSTYLKSCPRQELRTVIHWLQEAARRDHDAYMALQVLCAASDSMDLATTQIARDERLWDHHYRQQLIDLYEVQHLHELAFQRVRAQVQGSPTSKALTAAAAAMGGYRRVLDEVRSERDVSDRRRPREAAYARVREFARKLNLLLHEPTAWKWAKGSSPERDGTVPWPATDRETALGHRLYDLAAEVFAPVRNRDLSRVMSTRIAQRLLAPTGRIQSAVAAVWVAAELGLLNVDTTDLEDREVLEALQDEAKIVFKRQSRTAELPVAGADVPPGDPGRKRPALRHVPWSTTEPTPATADEMASVAQWRERLQDPENSDQTADDEMDSARRPQTDPRHDDRCESIADDVAEKVPESQGARHPDGRDT